MVVRRCRSLLRDEEQARDAAQDVFVKLLRHHRRLDGRAPASLLQTIATNTCLNLIRSRRRRPETPDDDLLDRLAATDSGEGRIAARLRLGRILGGAKPSTALIAILIHVDGLTLEQTATEVRMSVSGVRKRLRTLRKHARELEESKHE
jgi:RNA polymerase sigma-70 factor (ECF subfamily)